MTAYLDLSDISTSARGLATAISDQPGYAYLPMDSDPQVGKDAIEQAKIDPTRINTRYWGDLNTDALSPSHPKIRHHADLAWHHLKIYASAAGDSDVVLMVPSSWTSDTLKLLAGVCKSLNINVKAFINRSLAAGHSQRLSTFVQVDLQQHQTLLTFLAVKNGRLEISGTEKLGAFGLVRLQERWLHILRRRFISSYRFDPMHLGETEQQLFAQLCDYLSGNTDGLLEFKVAHEGQQYTAQFSEEEFSTPGQELLAEINTKSKDLPLVLDAYFSGIPGIEQAESTIVHSDHYFESAAHIFATVEHTGAEAIYIDSTELSDHKTQDSGGNAKDPVSGKAQATHLLVGGYAFPACTSDISVANNQTTLVKRPDENPCHIAVTRGNLCVGENIEGLVVNSQPAVAGEPLYVGDTVVLSGAANVVAIALRPLEPA